MISKAAECVKSELMKFLIEQIVEMDFDLGSFSEFCTTRRRTPEKFHGEKSRAASYEVLRLNKELYQQYLAARRLIEKNVRFVEVTLGGWVYGKSDVDAAEIVDDYVEVSNFNATIAHALGLPRDQVVRSPSNRPFTVANKAEPITSLF